MESFLVTYDLNQPGQRHASVVRAIKAYGTWARLSESSYAVVTHQSEQQVYDSIAQLIDRSDTLLVIPLRRPYQGWVSKELHHWLAQHLPHKNAVITGAGR